MSWVSNLISGVGRFAGFASKIGGVAQKFANAGGTIGKIASGVSKVANTISNYGGIAANAITKASPYLAIGGALAATAYKTGLLDKITGNRASKVVNFVRDTFNPNRGINQSAASAGASIGQQTGTGIYANALRGS